MIDTPQQPIDALRWRERIARARPASATSINTEPHGDHIRGNAYFPGVEVIGQAGMKPRYEEALPQHHRRAAARDDEDRPTRTASGSSTTPTTRPTRRPASSRAT